MIKQKETKKVRMDSWLLKQLPRDMKTKTKNKDQPTHNLRKQQKNKKEQESKSNGKYNTYHGLLSQKWVDGKYRSLI